jgi:hypothetical protein
MSEIKQILISQRIFTEKLVSRHEMCAASDGLKKVFTETRPKSINFAPSHLSSFGINISFGVISRGTDVSLTLGSFVSVRGFTLGTSHHVVIIG